MFIHDPVTVYNTKKFKILISGYYEPYVPAYCLKFKIPPVITPEKLRQRASYSTALIVDATYEPKNGIVIHFMKIEDLKLCMEIIMDFMEYVTHPHFVATASSTAAYKKCQAVLPNLTNEYDRWLHYLSNKHPGRYDHLKGVSHNSVLDKFKRWLT